MTDKKECATWERKMDEGRRLLQECHAVLSNAGSIPFVTGTYKQQLIERIEAELVDSGRQHLVCPDLTAIK